MIKKLDFGGASYCAPNAKVLILRSGTGICQTSGMVDESLEGLGFVDIVDDGDLN